MKLDASSIPYGVSDFRTIREEGLYYVDKTAYLTTLEQAGRFVFFVRPRRFGKSLFISMMRYYYDINEKDNFEKYFGDLAIAKNPTSNRNKYLMFLLDFSKVEGMGGRTVEERFANYMDAALIDFINRYRAILPPGMFQNVSRESKYRVVIDAAKDKGLPLYLIIDEYDNFTNSLIRSAGNDPYRIITHGTGFYRAWFKLFKGDFDRIFMTGVSPVTMDDLTSGFNIAKNISQDARFNSMLGFSESEVLQLYRDFKGAGEFTEGDPEAIVKSIKPWYDGYCFAREKIGRESVFNSDMVLYHLHAMVFHGLPPENMVDVNISTDYDKLETIVDLQRQMGAENVEDVSPITENPVRGGIDGEIRLQGYMQAEFGHITYYLARPEMELARGYCDFCLFPERVYNGDVRHSYIVELKYSKPDATETELAVKSEEGIAQLHRYAADPFVPALTKDTELHLILYHFKGKEIFRLEELKG